MLSAELVNYMNNSLANRLKREQEKQMESSKQEAEDRSRSGLKQTAAAIIEPNVIDIDAALAQMEEQKDRRSEKQTEAERKKGREADSKKKNMQESDPARERITAKSKKTMRAEQRRSEKNRRQPAVEEQQSLKQTAKAEEREVTEEQIAACDALFDKLLQGISTT